MKVRRGFVTNSSSSSYIISKANIPEFLREEILNMIRNCSDISQITHEQWEDAVDNGGVEGVSNEGYYAEDADSIYLFTEDGGGLPSIVYEIKNCYGKD